MAKQVLQPSTTMWYLFAHNRRFQYELKYQELIHTRNNGSELKVIDIKINGKENLLSFENIGE
jgi:hypothetical protein